MKTMPIRKTLSLTGILVFGASLFQVQPRQLFQTFTQVSGFILSAATWLRSNKKSNPLEAIPTLVPPSPPTNTRPASSLLAGLNVPTSPSLLHTVDMGATISAPDNSPYYPDHTTHIDQTPQTGVSIFSFIMDGDLGNVTGSIRPSLPKSDIIKTKIPEDYAAEINNADWSILPRVQIPAAYDEKAFQAELEHYVPRTMIEIRGSMMDPQTRARLHTGYCIQK